MEADETHPQSGYFRFSLIEDENPAEAERIRQCFVRFFQLSESELPQVRLEIAASKPTARDLADSE